MDNMDIKDITINEVEAFSNDNRSGVIISWSANIGWGELSFYKDNSDGKWIADTECMSNNENKEFIRMILNKWIDDIEVSG